MWKATPWLGLKIFLKQRIRSRTNRIRARPNSHAHCSYTSVVRNRISKSTILKLFLDKLQIQQHCPQPRQVYQASRRIKSSLNDVTTTSGRIPGPPFVRAEARKEASLVDITSTRPDQWDYQHGKSCPRYVVKPSLLVRQSAAELSV